MEKFKNTSTEELTKIASRTSKYEVDVDIERSTLRFIKEYKILDGSAKIPNHIIYYNYKKLWSKGGAKIPRVQFFKEFKKTFTLFRTGKSRYYLIACINFLFNKKMWDKSKAFNKGQ